MDTKNISSTQNVNFKMHRSYTPEEIIASGGTVAFGKKMGKNNQTLADSLAKAPAAEKFTEQEWEETIRQLDNDK